MEELAKLSNLSIQHSISLSVPLLSALRDHLGELKRASIHTMYKNIVYALEKTIQYCDLFFERQNKQVLITLERVDIILFRAIASQPFDFSALVKYLLSNLFIGPCKFETTLHIYDLIIQSSSDMNPDPILPSAERWITWVCSSMFILSRNLFIEGSSIKTTVIDAFAKCVAKVSTSELHQVLEASFVKPVRDSLIAKTIRTYHVDKAMDDVVSISEQDLIALEEPGYDKELFIWRKKIAAQRKIRLRTLMMRWKLIAKSLTFWIRFVNYLKLRIKESKRLKALAFPEPKEETYAAPVAIPAFKKNSIDLIQKKVPSNLFTTLAYTINEIFNTYLDRTIPYSSPMQAKYLINSEE